jgi:ERCC4-type nuclease
MIIVDVRENKLIEVLRELNHEHEVKQLNLGDIILRDPKNVDNVIYIERKSLRDLEDSIKDGRYSEQKSRMMNSNVKFLYIIENYSSFGSLSTMCKGALINTSIRDMVNILYSSCLRDTAVIVTEIYKRFVADPAKYLCPKPLDHDATLCVSTKKSDNNNKNNVYIRQLCVIPGISYKKAKNIITHSNTSSLYELVKKIKDEDYQLTGVENIGKKMEKTIKEFIL